MSLPRVTISDFSVDTAVTFPGDADANTPYVTLDDVAIYKHDLVSWSYLHKRFLIVFLHQINAIWKMHYCLAQCPAFLPAFQNNFTKWCRRRIQ